MLPREALSMQLRAENTDERARLQRQVRAHAALSDPDFRTEVVRLLRSRVVFGGTSSEEVAHYFSLHPRSLLRKLRAYGTTFRTLLGDMRFEVACQLLEGTRLSVTEIGIVLGYADTAIFTRAFERWSGTAPSRWRGRHHAGPSLARTYSGSPIRRPTEASGPWRGPPTNGADRHRRVHVRKGQAS